MLKTAELSLVTEWDKTFPKSKKVEHKKVTFVNRYGITLAADMYIPKNVEGKLPAIAVSGPFGAVKEQCSGLYAQTMAERGYLTIPGAVHTDLYDNLDVIPFDKMQKFLEENGVC